MEKSKYGKYIVTGIKPNVKMPAYRVSPTAETKWSTHFLYLDEDVIKGSIYFECVWFWEPDPSPAGGPSPHTHDFDELLGFCGTNFEDPNDLGGEIEFWIDDEKHVLTKSCIIFIPKGLKHCPLKIKRIDKPIFHFGAGTTGRYWGEEV